MLLHIELNLLSYFFYFSFNNKKEKKVQTDIKLLIKMIYLLISWDTNF